MSNLKRVGDIGEMYATKLLIKKGYEILEKNFRCRYGEIDIIAVDQDTLVFVEVKTRKNTRFGYPEEAVTPKKIKNIVKVAELYILKNKLSHLKYRIDIVSILARKGLVIRSKIIKIY